MPINIMLVLLFFIEEFNLPVFRKIEIINTIMVECFNKLKVL